MAAKKWTGRILVGLIILFMAADAITHIMRIPPVIEAFNKLSIPESLSIPLGIIVLACLALFAFRPTRILAAVLLTGYLGGAVAIHMRAQSTAFEMVFPVIIGAILWGGLYLIDTRVATIIRGNHA